ncbi:MAG: hypothetical protein K2J99_03980, partial [Lachnospiraceae bacterium]|nr:hypothetical protein [Lachnospiraceae bacterium]
MNVMIYCSTQAVYDEMEKCIKNNEHIVLVSTNIGLLNSQRGKTTGVILDSENTYFSKESFEIIEQLNQIIEKAIDASDNYLYEIPLRIEGGLGGRIQSLLYLIDIFRNIVRTNNIQKIYFEEAVGSLECMALLCVANSYGISVQGYNNSTLRERIYYSSYLPFRVLKTIYSNINTIKRIRAVSPKCSKDYHTEEFDVGFILRNSCKKYVNWSMEQMNFYDKEVKTAIFCYRVEEEKDIDALLSTGKTIKFVEAYGDWSIIIRSYWSHICNSRRIQKGIKKALKASKFVFQDIDVMAEIFYLFQSY